MKLTSLLLLLMAVTAHTDETLKFDGVLGQSQPDGAVPLPFIGANGVMADKQGNLWTATGTSIFSFSRQPDGRRIGVEAGKLPSPARCGVLGDGENAYVLGGNFKVYAFDPMDPRPTPVATLEDLADAGKRLCFAVAPAATTGSFAAKAKFFALDGDTVRGYTADGSPLGIVLTLSRPEGAAWWYCALGVEPSSGDLLVGSYYPDMKVYRYDSTGQAVEGEGWPRPGFSRAIVTVDTMAWMLMGGAAQSLPPIVTVVSDATTVGPYWTEPANGIAPDTGGGYWIASAQGLVQFDSTGQPTKRRLGGLAGVRFLTVGKDGTLIAAIENGVMIRLTIDDAPDAVFQSNANEPFRVGAGWTGRASGLAWDGQRFVVLDGVAKQFWGFDPWQTARGEKPWTVLAKPAELTKPALMAQGGERLWVLDEGRILETNLADLKSCRAIQLPDGLSEVTALAGAPDGDTLLVANARSVSAYRRGKDGAYTKVWNRSDSGENITGLAVTRQSVVVADKAKRSITAMSLADGQTTASVGANEIKGGFQPTCLTSSERWIFAADEEGQRIVRLKLIGN